MHDIRIENLTVRTQGGTVLVDDVSLAFGPDRPVCLIGETGSGKSLIMHAVMGSLPDSLVCEGKILFDGVDLLTQTADARRALWGRKIALLPQEPWLALDPTMRVQGQVTEVYTALHGVPAREAGQKADGELSAVGLAHAGNAYPFELSGGMAQRVSIAMAHAGGSPVMLADEPTKGLDRALCKVVGELLCFEVALGRAMMVITHDLELAEQVGGTVGVMRRGRLLEVGAAAHILSEPSDPYTRDLVASLPRNWPVRDHPHPRNDATLSGDKAVVTGRGIGKSFGERQLFSGLDITLNRGEITVVLGPSGSGKSTLGNILLGLMPFQEGTVVRPGNLPAMRYQKIYQDPPSAFIAHQTLGQGFDDLRRLHGIDRARQTAMMESLGLDRGLLARPPSAISGGELQRFAIARSLLLDPVMLFADEATSRLDPVSQKRVIDLLVAQVRERDLALLLVTHDEVLAERIADRIIRIDNARTATTQAKAA